MSILNEMTNGIKTREVKNISSIYTTQAKEDTELKDDIILIGNVNHNSILKSLKLSSSEAAAGLTADVILLNGAKEEIDGLTALKEDIAFTTALDNSECLDATIKFGTLEDYIVAKTETTFYRGQLFIALKIKTPATTAKAGLKILADINFIENI